MIPAILQAQWRSMRTFRISANPAATILSSLLGLLFYGFWAGMAFGAYLFFNDPDNAEHFSLALTGGLLLMFLYWQVTPVITASMGASLDLKKLLPYPIPHEKLFAVEVLLRFTTCAEMLIVLTGVVLGLRRYGVTVFFAAALFILFNLLLSAGVRNLLERILLRKRMREVMMFLFVTVSILPQVLLRSGFAFKNKIPELSWHPLLAIALLLALVALSYFFSRWQFERSLFTEISQPAVKSGTAGNLVAGLYNLPARFFPDPTAAIIEKELRSLFRTPSFRLILIMGSSFGLLMWFPHLFAKGAKTQGFMSGENVITFSSVYALVMLGQVTYFNCFGFERSAVQFWFSVPVPIARTIVAKNLTIVVFICIELVIVTVGSLVFRMPITPLRIVESVCVTFIAATYMIAIGNIASVRVPRILNADKLNQGGSSKAMNILMVLTFPIVLLPIGLAYWARSVFESGLIFSGLLAFAAIFGAILYRVGLTSAVATANQRREKILTELSRGDGPLSIA